MAADLLDKYGNNITKLTLIPSSGGVYEVMKNDQVIFSKKELNRFPAKRGVMFQKITQFLSNFSWLAFLIFAFFLRSAIQKKAGNPSLS